MYSYDSRSWGFEQCARPLHPAIQCSLILVHVLGMLVDQWTLSAQITSWPPQYHFPFIPLTLEKMPLWFIYFIYWSLSLSSTKATLKRVSLKRNEVHQHTQVKEYLLSLEKSESFSLHEKFTHLSSGHNKLQELQPPGEPRQEKGKGIE